MSNPAACMIFDAAARSTFKARTAQTELALCTSHSPAAFLVRNRASRTQSDMPPSLQVHIRGHSCSETCLTRSRHTGGKANKSRAVEKGHSMLRWENNLVDSGSGFKNAHRRRARRSSLWPPMPPQSMLRSRKRIVFFKNGRLFFPRVRHSSWQLPTLNKGAWGRGGRPELCWMGVYLSRTGIQATREIGHAQCKNEVSLRLACLPSARPALLVGPEWDSEGPTIGQL